jgi:hypothetical protein
MAKEIRDHDPKAMKTRPYLWLLLVNLRFSEKMGSNGTASLLKNLQFSPGITFFVDHFLLPMGIRCASENPGWPIQDAAAELKESIAMILTISGGLDDYITEGIALSEAIRLNSNPRDEFNQLCHLQKARQGNKRAHAFTLVSKYLVSETDESRKLSRN